jgi:hypothetical protein
VVKSKKYTVFPQIVSAETILFWNFGCIYYSRDETIQRRKLLTANIFESGPMPTP